MLRDATAADLPIIAAITAHYVERTAIHFAYQPPTVAELSLVEPDPKMSRRLRRRLAGSDRAAAVFEAPAERRAHGKAPVGLWDGRS